MSQTGGISLDRAALRDAIQEEYDVVAREPDRGFHFHTGRKLARLLGYEDEWLDAVPESAVESFAGTGNPFALGAISSGERVVDVGSGAGIDSFIAATKTGPEGRVIGIDMTPAMLEKARAGIPEMPHANVEFRQGFGEGLPIEDGWADVVISNGVLNLMPDKNGALREMARVLKPEGRIQIGDIMVQRAVPENAKENIDLWTG
jgi:arsenite methyltransferase